MLTAGGRGRSPATLVGDRRALREVAALAMATVGPTAPREWLLRLEAVRHDRRAVLRELRQVGHGVRSREVARQGERFGALGILWWVALSAGAVLVTAGAALLLPPKRWSVATLADNMAAAPAAMVAGALVLGFLALLPVPGVVRESTTATATALGSGALVLAATVYNATRVPQLLSTPDGDRTGPYFVAAAVALDATGTLALRARARPPHHRDHWRQAARQAHRNARWLLRRSPGPGQGGGAPSGWGTGLDRRTSRLDRDVVAQAWSLGPWHLLVAACYDGELDLPQLRIPPPGTNERGRSSALRA